MADLTQARLRELLNYNPETGDFVWLKTASAKATKGSVAGCLYHPRNYRIIRVDQVRYPAHRLVWLYVHGRWPSNEIDHINANPSDNRLANLREATVTQNKQNTGPHKDAQSGLKGMWYRRERSRWVAQIVVGGELKRLGSFRDKLAAARAYDEAARKYFGEFARCNFPSNT